MNDIGRFQRLAASVGGIAVVLCVAAGFFNSTEFYRSYLLAFLFWVSLALGSLGIRLLHNVVGGKWGVIIGRFLESGVRTLPLMGLLVLPVLAGIPALYEWSHHEAVAHDVLLQHKAPYLNVPFFVIRTIGYFAFWILLSVVFQRRTKAGFERGRIISAPGLILFAFTVTFAAVDWIMSLEPHWFSTIYGAIFLVGQTLQTFAFCVALLALLANREPFARVLQASHFHDLGNLLLAFTALWAYTSFSQFLIIWSGNIPEETVWYIRRSNGGWQVVSVILMAFHFAVPFAVLLSRRVKRQGRALARIAVWIIIMRIVDLVYWVEPAFHDHHLATIWMRLLALTAVGGLWIAFFLWQLQRQPLLDVADPRLELGGVAH
jgi:hypothetical protein